MTAVSESLPETAFGRAAATHPLRWDEKGFVFEIQSADADVLKIARRIFAVQTMTVSGEASRSWRIERSSIADAEGWIVSASSRTSSMIPVRADNRDAAILHVEYDALDWMINNTPGSIVVHAALLSRNDRGVMIVGPSLAGKSTLATALWRDGWSLLSDDLVFIDAHNIASPAPRRVSLRKESKDLVGNSLWNTISETPSCVETQKGLFFHPHEVSGSVKQRQTKLSAIFFLARRESNVGSAESRPLNQAKAALALVPYAFNVRAQPFMDALKRVTPLIEHVPAFDLGRGDLSAMVGEVESNAG